VGAVAGTRRGK